VVILFPIAGAIRLALFKVGVVTGYFVGLPITAAGGMTASLVISRVDFTPLGLIIVVILLATLMVSRIRYPNMKRLNARDIRLWKILLFIGVATGVAIAVALVDPMRLILLPSIIYILYGIKNWVLFKVHVIKEQPYSSQIPLSSLREK